MQGLIQIMKLYDIMDRISWEKRALIGASILTVGIVMVGIGVLSGFNLIGLGFGLLFSAYWRKTHPDSTMVIADKKTQRKRTNWRGDLKQTIISSKTDRKEKGIALSSESEKV